MEEDPGELSSVNIPQRHIRIYVAYEPWFLEYCWGVRKRQILAIVVAINGWTLEGTVNGCINFFLLLFVNSCYLESRHLSMPDASCLLVHFVKCSIAYFLLQVVLGILYADIGYADVNRYVGSLNVSTCVISLDMCLIRNAMAVPHAFFSHVTKPLDIVIDVQSTKSASE